MALTVGTQLGSHEIVALLGKGGMGEVYRARDLKLKREVAIKVLPEEFSRDADRVSRFQREAEVLASLNHPNIAHIYGVEERALAMELVDGESPKGPMPLEGGWKIALQIAEALEYAHEKGVIHRDLKPANIKVTPEGVVKLLDFGLAKAFNEQLETGINDLANSPTVTFGGTVAGTIMGTAAYMAPEQAKGKRVDKRADIWAWGVVFYELLTGERLFKGEDPADTLAHVLTQEPDLTKAPKQVRLLLGECLQRDPKLRLRDIGDAKRLLETESETSPKQANARSPFHSTWLPWTLVGALVITLAGSVWMLRPRQVELKPLTRLNVDLGPDAVAGMSTTVAISPDGTRIVFPVRGEDGKQRLATRLLDQAKETVLSGTEDGRDPFFSPDGQWIGFFSPGKMKKISVLGGAPVTLCDAAAPKGASWGDDGYIVANLINGAGLFRIPDSGGKPEPLTTLRGVLSHRWPQILPRGRGVLFTATSRNNNQEGAAILVQLPKSGEAKTLLQNAYFGRFIPANERGGFLLYMHEGTMFGVPFDVEKLELRGKPAPLLEDIAADSGAGGGQFGFSNDGTFVYLPGTASDSTTPVAWLDSAGKNEPLLATERYGTPRLSPDGQTLALTVVSGSSQNVYVYDLQRLTMHRLTFAPTNDGYPTWTPDGKHIAFSSGGNNISWVRADGAGPVQPLLEKTAGSTNILPYSFSPDGRRLSYYEIRPDTLADIWTVALDLKDPDHPKPGKSEPFLQTPFVEDRGAFSPDGRWMAYESNESGEFQIYVQPFPGPGGKWQVSNTSGRYATWSRSGKQLFFETADGYIMVVDYTVNGDTFIPGKPRQWSPVQLREMGSLNMTVHPDGKRFVVFPSPVKSVGGKTGNLDVTFLLNFADELRQRVPDGK
jgi:serine/threonine-protein kinase